MTAEKTKSIKLVAKKPFSWAHGGHTVKEYAEGVVLETADADLIEVATREKWAAKATKADEEAHAAAQAQAAAAAEQAAFEAELQA